MACSQKFTSISKVNYLKSEEGPASIYCLSVTTGDKYKDTLFDLEYSSKQAWVNSECISLFVDLVLGPKTQVEE